MSSSSKVFVPDTDHVWLAADIVADVDETGFMEVRTDDCAVENSNRRINIRKLPGGLTVLPLQNLEIPTAGVEDMCSLSYLHEASILDNLRRRFANKFPYTYTGEICIALNPYQWLDIYSAELRESYSLKLRHECSPHAYATSAAAYRGLRDRYRNQSILVSGESGAGKTETVKILMNHVASISSKKGDSTIDKVLKANPLLESFGNAKTVRNDNSSRFGKFTELQFDDNSLLVGSKCVTYLLEKSRVVSQSEAERNYHVLYQILAAPAHVTSRLELTGKRATDFAYTCCGDTATSVIEGISDSDRYNLTTAALDLLGVELPLRELVEQVLAGVLFLGQMKFQPINGNADTSELDATSPESAAHVRSCCKMFGLDVAAYNVNMTQRTIDVEGQRLAVPLSVEQAVSGRDALAKEVYARIFQWLVHVINFNTYYKPKSSGRVAVASKSIALLDIFGFESFKINRFEQLCINFANEKLQQKFTQDVFKTVQSEYKEEGLQWEAIGFSDNADVLDLLEGRKGVIASLNEECLVPRGSDVSFLNKIKQSCASYPAFSINLTVREEFCVQHYAGKVSYSIAGFMERNKDTMPEDMRVLLSTSTNPLIVSIFSGLSCLYGSNNNVSEVDELLFEDRTIGANALLLSMTRRPDGTFVQAVENTKTMAHSDETADVRVVAGAGKHKRRASFMMAETVTTKFKSQLSQLMNTIGATEVQYVRCIKPNTHKSSTEFCRQMVVEQLRSAGMIEAIRISRAAYPYHITHEEFLLRFQILRSKSWHKAREEECEQDHLRHSAPVPVCNPSDNDDDSPSMVIMTQERFNKQARCKAMIIELLAAPPASPIKASASNTAKAVKTTATPSGKVFELGRTKVYFSAGVLEQLESHRTKMVVRKVLVIQKIFRGWRLRRKYLIKKRMCVRLQTYMRMYLATQLYFRQCRSTLLIQSSVRRMIARILVLAKRRYRAAMRIQAVARMGPHWARYVKARHAIILLQSIGKMLLRKKLYIRIRDKAREDREIRNQLQLTKDKLEEEVAQREVLQGQHASEMQEARLALLNEQQLREELQTKLLTAEQALQSVSSEALGASAVLQASLAAVTAKVEDLTRENGTLKTALVGLSTKLHTEKTNYETQLQTATANLQLAFESEKADLKTANDQMLESLNATHTSQISDLANQLTSANADITDLKMQLSSSMDNAMSVTRTLNDDILQLKIQCEDQEILFLEQLSVVRGEKEQHSNQAAASALEIAALTKKHSEELTEIKSAFEARLAEQHNSVMSLHEQQVQENLARSAQDILDLNEQHRLQLQEISSLQAAQNIERDNEMTVLHEQQINEKLLSDQSASHDNLMFELRTRHEAELSDIKLICNDLMEELAEEKSNFEKLTFVNVELKASTEQSTTELTEERSKTDKLNSDNAELNAKTERFVLELTEERSRYEALQFEVAQQRSRFGALASDIESRSNIINTTIIERDGGNNSTKVEELTSQLSAAHSELRELKTELAGLVLQLANTRSDNMTMRASESRRTSESPRSTSPVPDVPEQVQQIEMLNQLKSLRDQLESDHVEHENDLTEMRTAAAAQAARYSELQQQYDHDIATGRSIISDLKTRLKQHDNTAQLNQANSTTAKPQSDLHASAEFANMQIENSDLQARVMTLEAELRRKGTQAEKSSATSGTQAHPLLRQSSKSSGITPQDDDDLNYFGLADEENDDDNAEAELIIKKETSNPLVAQAIRHLESKQGLTVTMYLLTKADGTAKPKQTTLRKVVDQYGVQRIECELSTHSAAVAHGDSSKALRKLRFKVEDLRKVAPGRGSISSIPDNVDEKLCLSMDIQLKGELNLVFESVECRNAAVDCFAILMTRHKVASEAKNSLASTETSSDAKTGHPLQRAPAPAISSTSATTTTDSSYTASRSSSVAARQTSVAGPPGSSFNSRSAPVVLMQGYVRKEDTKQAHLVKTWTRRYLVLEKDSRMLKYGVSEETMGQAKGVVHLCRGMKCAQPVVKSGGMSLMSSIATLGAANDALTLEISGLTGLLLKIQLASDKELMLWQESINSVIEEANSENSKSPSGRK